MTPDAGMRRVIVCADDFGMSAAIDDGILELVRLGRLSAVSCMTHAPAFARDAERLRDVDADLGLHLNFTESLGQPGFYLPLSRLIVRAYGRTLDTRRVTAQIESQLDAFVSHLGRAPDFIDGHQHVHQLPQIRTALLDVVRRRFPRNPPWLRCSAPGRLAGLPAPLRWKAHVIGALGAHAFARAAVAAGQRTNRRLLGVYGFDGGEQAYGTLLPLWLGNARDGDLLMCHPAMPGAEAGDGMTAQRMAEFRVLARPAWTEWLLDQGLRIVRYADI